MKPKWSNWARTNTCRPQTLSFPKTLSELQQHLQTSINTQTPLKIVGHGDSYNTIFHTDHHLISLKHLNTVLDIDSQAETITVEAGTSVPDAIHAAADKGLGFSNLGTSMFDTCAGACFTGHHGSGLNYGILSDHLLSFDLLTGTGKTLTISKGDWLYDALGVNLGAAGIVTNLTLKLEPRFKLKQHSHYMPFNECLTNYNHILATHDHVKFIWAPHTNDIQCWVADRTDEPCSSWLSNQLALYRDGIGVNNVLHALLLYPARVFPGFIRPINRFLSRYFLHPTQTRVAWAEDIFYLPHLMKQDAVEYAIPAAQTAAFLQDLRSLIASEFHVQFPIEIRFVKEDNFWLSPAYKTPMCYVGTKSHLLPGITFNYEPYFRAVNNLVERYQGRPHWGKQLYSSPNYFNQVFDRWNDFWTLCSLLDPKYIFRNTWLDTLAYTPTPADQEQFKSQFDCNAL